MTQFSIKGPLFVTGLSLAVMGACSAGSGSGSGDDRDGGEDGAGAINIGEENGDGVYVNPDSLLPPTKNCGDGILDDDEVCDDGGKENDDGCFGNCRGIEIGYICPKPAEKCQRFAICGDGVTAFPEQCDDGNEADGDGCSGSCKLELGFKCPTNNEGLSSCSPTNCGDGIVEGTEKCEGGATAGCTDDCQFLPTCDDNGVCTSACGDGLLLGEACDDGNTLSGDGCSDVCEEEHGYKCVSEVTSGECDKSPDTGECILRVPVVFRDFSQTHSDFSDALSPCGKNVGSPTAKLVKPQLEAGRPIRAGTASTIMCNENFADWYKDIPGTNVTVRTDLVLYDDGAGNYVNRWKANGDSWYTNYGWDGAQSCAAEPCGPFGGNPFFFPLDGIDGALDDGGQTAEVSTEVAYGMDGSLKSEQQLTGAAPTHNFGFTSEVTYPFTYTTAMDALLEFIGDDDVYVFIGGKLALDLGGLHGAAAGTIELKAGRIKVFIPKVTFTEEDKTPIDMTVAEFGLQDNGVYDIKIFHAERKPTGSTFKLTLSGFETRRSICNSDCGDGILALGEQCDDGVNDGGPNECGEGCKLGSYCGDGVKDEWEDCDDNDPAAPADCNGCRIVVVR